MIARAIDRHRVALLLIVAIAARALTFGNPVVHVDEEFYFATAHAMWRGAVPFIDIWDRKPVGLFLLYMPAAALPLPWGTWAYQAMALTSVVATAWIIARIATLAGWAHGARLGGVAYILWLNLCGGQGGQAPVFYDLPMAAAALAIIANQRRRFAVDAAAMLLVGVALQIKYSAVFEGMFFGLWIMMRDVRANDGWVRVLAKGAMLAMLALAPTLAAWGWYAAHGWSDQFLFANFWSIMARHADPARERWGNLAKLVLLLSPLIAMAIAARHRGDRSPTRAFAFAWLGVSLSGILMFGGWFDHYALPACVPAAVCAAGFLGARRRRRWVAPAVLALVAVAGQITILANRLGRGGPGEFAALAQSVGRGPGCLYVYSGNTSLYAATDRCRLSRYVFPSHLYRTREAGAIGVDQASEVARILNQHPAVVVMRPPSIGEQPAIRHLVLHDMAANYRLKAMLPMGSEKLAVFVRR